MEALTSTKQKTVFKIQEQLRNTWSPRSDKRQLSRSDKKNGVLSIDTPTVTVYCSQ